jgi:hypothetical protein
MIHTESSSADFERKILEEAIHSPAVAMMRLSIEIDRQLRLILAVIGRLKDYTSTSPTEAVDLIATTDPSTPRLSELRDTLDSFWGLRNEVVHGKSREVLAMRAVDYGLRILRVISSIPRPAFIVEVMVPLFMNKECSELRTDVSGVILNARRATGESTRQIHPTRKHYIQGQSLSWEWDFTGPGWEETWYIEPATREIKLAWSESLEFIGRPLEQI